MLQFRIESDRVARDQQIDEGTMSGISSGALAQAGEANPKHKGKLQWFGLALAISAVIAAVAVAPGSILSGYEEPTATVRHVGDRSQLVSMPQQ